MQTAMLFVIPRENCVRKQMWCLWFQQLVKETRLILWRFALSHIFWGHVSIVLRIILDLWYIYCIRISGNFCWDEAWIQIGWITWITWFLDSVIPAMHNTMWAFAFPSPITSNKILISLHWEGLYQVINFFIFFPINLRCERDFNTPKNSIKMKYFLKCGCRWIFGISFPKLSAALLLNTDVVWHDFNVTELVSVG